VAEYPLHRGERAGLRASWRDHIIEKARIEADLYGLSSMCRASNHAPHGCLNDGRTCLCACHDPAVSD
jgi:hypothetical protein